MLYPDPFKTPGILRDGELSLRLKACVPADLLKGYVPAYSFVMDVDGKDAGDIGLRIGNSPPLRGWCGHIGYDVEEAFRGHRYAARSVRLLLPLAYRHAINPLWITCAPDNIASARSCELAGGVYVETIAIPEGTEMYNEGRRHSMRWCFDTRK